jgi:Holliday junction DNA helicase RuvB
MLEDENNNTSQDETVSRPGSLDDFNGQSYAKKNLQTFLSSAKKRQSSLDHTLFFGPPGLGKTTLARIISTELQSGFHQIGAPSIEKTSDIVTLLATIEERDVVFIDEIHRLPVKIEEMLYIAMEDFRMDLIVGEGVDAKTVSLPIPRFTLIGATTEPGKISNPLRDRFGIQIQLKTYTDEEMKKVILRASPQINLNVSAEAAMEIGRRSRGTPRIGLQLLNRIRDFIVTSNKTSVSIEDAKKYLQELGIDTDGLNETDRRYLSLLKRNYRNRSVGVKTIAAALNESIANIEESIEPYLIRHEFIEKTPSGRRLLEKSIERIQ